MLPNRLTGTPTPDLLSGYRRILHELRVRGLLRTNNAPTGDYAEYLVSRCFGGELAPNSEKSWDVRRKNGLTVQVKARVLTEGKSGERQLSAIRTWDFDLLAVVLFKDDYTVQRSVLIPSPAARESSRFVPHVNGYRIIATDAFLDRPDATDITQRLRDIAAGL